MTPSQEAVTKTPVVERVHFRMPTDLELLFPAVAAMQNYVNGYSDKVSNKIHDGSMGKAEWTLQYSHDIDAEIWAMFKSAGLVLAQEPVVPTVQLDMIADMRDERLQAFYHNGKHACQICGVMCGVDPPSLPLIRRIRPKTEGGWYGINGGFIGLPQISFHELLKATDGLITGVVGAGWQLYLAASMGLPVIEYVPVARPVSWLSKFANGGYRAVVDNGAVPRLSQIQRAQASIEAMLARMARREADNVRGQQPGDSEKKP